MPYNLIPIIAVLLLTACNKKAAPSGGRADAPTASNTVPTAAGVTAWGSSKSEIMAKLEQVKAKVISDHGDLVLAELGPAGLTSSDGKAVTRPLRLEYHFKDGKLAEMKTGL